MSPLLIDVVIFGPVVIMVLLICFGMYYGIYEIFACEKDISYIDKNSEGDDSNVMREIVAIYNLSSAWRLVGVQLFFLALVVFSFFTRLDPVYVQSLIDSAFFLRALLFPFFILVAETLVVWQIKSAQTVRNTWKSFMNNSNSK